MFGHRKLLFNRHIRRGLLRFLILAKLSAGRMYGYEILKLVRERTKGKAKVNAGEIYSILDGLENKGYARSRWVVTAGKSSRPKKMFDVTRKGRGVVVAGRKYLMSVFREFQAGFPEVFGE